MIRENLVLKVFTIGLSERMGVTHANSRGSICIHFDKPNDFIGPRSTVEIRRDSYESKFCFRCTAAKTASAPPRECPTVTIEYP